MADRSGDDHMRGASAGASWPVDGCGCRVQLLTLFADRGSEMVVSAQPPLVPSPYEDLGLRCPHGTRWYTEPTSDQQLAWAAATGSGR